MLEHTFPSLSMETTYPSPTGHVEQEELLLVHQWAKTIGTQVAPLELLQHYAALSRQNSEAVNKNLQNGRDNASALSPLLPEERIPPKGNIVDNNSHHAENRQSGSVNALTRFLEGDNSNIRNTSSNIRNPLTEQAHAMNGHRASDFGEPESIMPPQVVAQLPPLITAQRIDMPPLPVAASTARFGARAEMMIDEDLDVLAAKIKRILDDEARRHGIDV